MEEKKKLNGKIEEQLMENKSDNSSVRERLKDFRIEQLGFKKQVDAATSFGLPRAKYAHYENNAKEIPIKFLKLLALHHDLNINWLLTGIGHPTLEDEKLLSSLVTKEAEENPHEQIMRKYSVFLCFAEEDENIAYKLSEILHQVNLTIYLSSIKNYAAGDEKHIETLRKIVERSQFFIPIVTRFSLKRPLWSFLTGMAASHGKPILPATVMGLEGKHHQVHLGRFPVHFEHFYQLYRKAKLDLLLASVLAQRNNENIVKHLVLLEEQLPSDMITHQSIVSLAAKRWCYISGTIPEIDKNKKIENLLIELIKSLLERGFSISINTPSTDFINLVGITVSRWKKEKKASGINLPFLPEYKIESAVSKRDDFSPKKLHRDVREYAIGKRDDHLDNTRRNYLSNKEWYILLNGGNDSEREYEIIKDINAVQSPSVKVYALPCSGGFAEKVFEQLPLSYKRFCKDCVSNNSFLDANCPNIPRIVDFMWHKYL